MITEKLPLISCLMITRGRVVTKEAIRCYMSQNYPNKELVILCQEVERVTEELERYVNGLNRPDIFMLRVASSLSLGQLRNVSASVAQGEVLCQWDDDDFSHPFRLTTQYKRLRSSSFAVASCYNQFLKAFSYDDADGVKESIYYIDAGNNVSKYAWGSVMFNRSSFTQYADLIYPQQSLKESILPRLAKIGAIVPVHEGYQYIYRYDGTNALSLWDHQLALYDVNILSAEEITRVKSQIDETLTLFGKPATIVTSQYLPTGTHYSKISCEPIYSYAIPK